MGCGEPWPCIAGSLSCSKLRGAAPHPSPSPSLPAPPAPLPLGHRDTPTPSPPPSFLGPRSVRWGGGGGGHTSGPPVSACLRDQNSLPWPCSGNTDQLLNGPKEGQTAKQGGDGALAGRRRGGVTGPERAGDSPMATQPAAATHLGPAPNLLAPPPSARAPTRGHLTRESFLGRGEGARPRV